MYQHWLMNIKHYSGLLYICPSECYFRSGFHYTGVHNNNTNLMKTWEQKGILIIIWTEMLASVYKCTFLISPHCLHLIIANLSQSRELPDLFSNHSLRTYLCNYFFKLIWVILNFKVKYWNEQSHVPPTVLHFLCFFVYQSGSTSTCFIMDHLLDHTMIITATNVINNNANNLQEKYINATF